MCLAGHLEESGHTLSRISTILRVFSVEWTRILYIFKQSVKTAMMDKVCVNAESNTSSEIFAYVSWNLNCRPTQQVEVYCCSMPKWLNVTWQPLSPKDFRHVWLYNQVATLEGDSSSPLGSIFSVLKDYFFELTVVSKSWLANYGAICTIKLYSYIYYNWMITSSFFRIRFCLLFALALLQ